MKKGANAKSRFSKGRVLEQKVGMVPVRISAGGAQYRAAGTAAEAEGAPLAEVATSAGRSLALYWQDELPEPTVSGPEATFDLGKNLDLKVTSLDTGFDARVELAQRPAGTPVYRFPIATPPAHLGTAPANAGPDPPTRGQWGPHAAAEQPS